MLPASESAPVVVNVPLACPPCQTPAVAAVAAVASKLIDSASDRWAAAGAASPARATTVRGATASRLDRRLEARGAGLGTTLKPRIGTSIASSPAGPAGRCQVRGRRYGRPLPTPSSTRLILARRGMTSRDLAN